MQQINSLFTHVLFTKSSFIQYPIPYKFQTHMHIILLIFNPELGQQTIREQKKGIACECVLKVNVLYRNNQLVSAVSELFLFMVSWTLAKSFKKKRKCRPRRSIKFSYY